jgi:four helix bundle protein
MFRFEKLEIWKLAISYANDIYDLTDTFPVDEKYNMTDQLRRSSLSISNNIAEGSGAATKKNFCSYLDISTSSCFETVNLLHFAKLRNYIRESKRLEMHNKAEVLVKKIRSFKNSLKSP